MPRSAAVRNRYCGQVSPKTDRPRARAQRICSDRLAARHVHDQDRHVDELGQRDRAVGAPRARPDRRWLARGKRGAIRPAASSRLRHPLDAVGVLGVDHRHRAVLARHRQHVEDLAVAELQVVVGHVDLERRVTLGDQAGSSSVRTCGRRVADDQVKGVVNMGLAIGAAVVVVDRGAQRVASFPAPRTE